MAARSFTGRLLSCLLVGLGCGAVEAVLVTVTDGRMFMSYRELLRMWLSALSVGGLGSLLAGLPWVLMARLPADPRRRGVWFVVAMSLPAFALSAYQLTAGRRVAEQPWRLWLVAALALSAAATLGLAVRQVDVALHDVRRRRPVALALAAIVLVCLVVDSLVLRRLYPVFHWSLSVVVLFFCVQLARLVADRVGGRVLRAAPALLALTLVGAPMLLRSVARAPSLRFSIEQSAPLSGKLLSVFPHASAPESSVRPEDPLLGSAPSAVAPPGAGAQLALGSPDVLLLTVDALRADALAAYGGAPGLTPAIDALAKESVVFERAYTPTPHTSYALTSLMTGKYMREVSALAGAGAHGAAGGEHATLASLLRRYGYRTAAFYPPAVFFVDGARFEGFRRSQLGFEYAKVMFASAAERVMQVQEYLRQASPEHPLFLWVHLFEPHEPYDPPPAFERGSGRRARYDGEVAFADDAIGKLVELFRARRPGATVIVSADHGEEFGEHGGQRHGSTLYDEQVRVPLLWSSPGAVQPGRVAVPVDLVDVSTTLLSALGMPPDARMRGRDLTGALVAPSAAAGEGSIAYAALDDAQMACDGRFKAICHRSGHCQLFDLRSDPAELRDLSGKAPARLAALRASLSALAASIPRVEAMSMSDAGDFPEALSRARVGDRSVAPVLPSLLGSRRPEVRAAAADACAALQVAAAVPVLARLRRDDPSPAVRAAAAVAGLRLGDGAAAAAVRGLVRAPAGGGPEGGVVDEVLRRRAALSLVAAGDAAGLDVVVALAADDTESERDRLAAIGALGALGDRRAVAPLLALMDHTRLRPAASAALGRLGGPGVLDALADALRDERYPEARAAEAGALVAAGDPRAVALLWRFLGTDSSVPGGLALLLATGRSLPCGVDLRQGWPGGSAGPGGWRCDARGCIPGADAHLPLTGGGERRLVLRLQGVPPGASLRVGATTLALRPGDQELSLPVPAGVDDLPIAGDGPLTAYACVPAREDIPPPPPEPWQPDGGQQLP